MTPEEILKIVRDAERAQERMTSDRIRHAGMIPSEQLQREFPYLGNADEYVLRALAEHLDKDGIPSHFVREEDWEGGQPNGMGTIEPTSYREWFDADRETHRRKVITFIGPWELSNPEMLEKLRKSSARVGQPWPSQ